jgi:hypothetical protein
MNGDYGFGDSVLELARRTDLGGVLELAPTDDEAATLLEALDEVAADEKAQKIEARMRRMGHTL